MKRRKTIEEGSSENESNDIPVVSVGCQIRERV